MKLKGSCHCRAVRFSLESHTPYPYLWCYCSICRKTAGGGERHYRQLIFLGSRANWAEVPGGRRFREYPKEAIVDWHRKRGVTVP